MSGIEFTFRKGTSWPSGIFAWSETVYKCRENFFSYLLIFFKNLNWSVLIMPKWANVVSFMKIGRTIRSSALMEWVKTCFDAFAHTSRPLETFFQKRYSLPSRVVKDVFWCICSYSQITKNFFSIKIFLTVWSG